MFGHCIGTLPTGWSADFYGSVEARDTGIRDAETGETMLTVVVRDDIPDLNECWLHRNGNAVFHATRSNGAIVDRNGKSVATMTLFLPSAPYDLRVEWQPTTGGLRQQSVQVIP